MDGTTRNGAKNNPEVSEKPRGRRFEAGYKLQVLEEADRCTQPGPRWASILREDQASRERRDQLRHPHYQKPELLAAAPNQVWSWDITKPLGPQMWT